MPTQANIAVSPNNPITHSRLLGTSMIVGGIVAVMVIVALLSRFYENRRTPDETDLDDPL